MVISDKNVLIKFTEDFCLIVENYVRYVIVSGFLAISTGRPRGTEDIDIIVERLTLEKFEKLHSKLLEKFEVIGLEDLSGKELYEEYLSKNIPIRYIYHDDIFPNMEFKFEKNIIDNTALKTRNKIAITQSNVYFSNINLQIAYKEKILQSQKDIEDAIHLREVFADEIDENEIKNYKKLMQEYLK